MSMEEINQLLTQMRKVSHQASGEATGIVSDTMTNILTTLGQKMAAMHGCNAGGNRRFEKGIRK